MFSIRRALLGATALILAACATPAATPASAPPEAVAPVAAEKPALIEFYADW
jgi:ABC-type glycerol-3-phosphate transport system substrate-binding protein